MLNEPRAAQAFVNLGLGDAYDAPHVFSCSFTGELANEPYL